MSRSAKLGETPAAPHERYDRVAYPGRPFPQTHPDRLATIATLFGMAPASVEDCRVLELGCGEGANLLPMAFTLPHSRFVGVDLAARAIAKGQESVSGLGLTNITLVRDDICRLGSDIGQFDYIIAHGLYAWIGREVREAVLRLIESCLAPHGVAYISYNTYPGGHLRKLAREMMLFHTRTIAEPEQQVCAAVALLEGVQQALEKGHPYGAFITAELQRLQERGAEYLFHDELAPVYEPVYFHVFVEQAAAHGLQYLAEAEFSDMQRPPLPSAAAELLDRVAGDLVLKEQYLDFFRCRSFRRTLLCHENVALNRIAEPECVLPFLVSSSLRSSSDKRDISSTCAEEFSAPHGSLKTRHPVTKALLCELAELWPVALKVPELLQAVRGRLGQPHADGGAVEQDRRCLCEVILRGFGAGLLELHVSQPRMCARPPDRPLASRLARFQLAAGEEEVTTLRHTTARVEGPIERRLLSLLDGTRDRPALLAELRPLLVSMNAGTTDLESHTAKLEQSLVGFARAGLLQA